MKKVTLETTKKVRQTAFRLRNFVLKANDAGDMFEMGLKTGNVLLEV